MSRNGELIGMVLLNMYDERINTKGRDEHDKGGEWPMAKET